MVLQKLCPHLFPRLGCYFFFFFFSTKSPRATRTEGTIVSTPTNSVDSLLQGREDN